MTKSLGFQFKQFYIRHDNCAMKVNTDGILLGSLVPIQQASHILDLGTGTGLVAIMLAQRSQPNCQITALELEPNAYQQAVENAKKSAWSDRLVIKQGDVLTTKFDNTFDLIVSNPPYFQHSLASRNQARDLARNATQSHLDWLLQAKKWLSPTGKICFILPFEAGERLINQDHGLFCTHQWIIYSKPNQPAKRMIVIFSLQAGECLTQSLTIYTAENRYTEGFKQLTQDFYLNF